MGPVHIYPASVTNKQNSPSPTQTYKSPHPLQGLESNRQLFCGLHSCLNSPSGLWYQSGSPAK